MPSNNDDWVVPSSTWVKYVTSSSGTFNTGLSSHPSQKSPMFHPEAQAKCLVCGTKPGYFSPSFHMKEGKHIASHLTVCESCLHKQTHRYCPDCNDIFKAKSGWCQPGANLNFVPCPKHSESKEVAKVKCSTCDEVSYPHHMKWNKRAQPYCTSCMDELTYCGASYCGNTIHPKHPDTVQAGFTAYCKECSIAPKTPTSKVPHGYNPYTWDYRVKCHCKVCCYLRGKDDRWPEPEGDGTFTFTFDSNCWDCNTPCSSEVDGKYHIPKHGDVTLCHVCTLNNTTECDHCGDRKHVSGYQPKVDFGEFEGSVCVDCLESLNWWFCDAQCHIWLPPQEECECGGIHPYNYTPEPIFHWSDKQRQSMDRPFLGLEIEVEAQVGDATRRKGAELARGILGDCAYVVHDGTLLGNGHPKWGDDAGGHHGFEIVTHPFTFEWFQENWSMFETLLTTLSNEGYRSWEGGRCGMHIHISRKPMTDGHQMKFIDFILSSAKLSLCIGQRGYRDKNLKQFSPFDADNRSQFMYKIRKNMNPGVHGHYTALNTNKPATLEGRWFRGTLNTSSFRKNVEFMHSVWYFTRRFGFTSANEINYIGWLREIPQARQYATLLDYIERQYVTRR